MLRREEETETRIQVTYAWGADLRPWIASFCHFVVNE